MYIFFGGGKEETFFSLNVVEQLNMLMGENKLRTLTYIINKQRLDSKKYSRKFKCLESIKKNISPETK